MNPQNDANSKKFITALNVIDDEFIFERFYSELLFLLPSSTADIQRDILIIFERIKSVFKFTDVASTTIYGILRRFDKESQTQCLLLITSIGFNNISVEMILKIMAVASEACSQHILINCRMAFINLVILLHENNESEKSSIAIQYLQNTLLDSDKQIQTKIFNHLMKSASSAKTLDNFLNLCRYFTIFYISYSRIIYNPKSEATFSSWICSLLLSTASLTGLYEKRLFDIPVESDYSNYDVQSLSTQFVKTLKTIAPLFSQTQSEIISTQGGINFLTFHYGMLENYIC